MANILRRLSTTAEMNVEAGFLTRPSGGANAAERAGTLQLAGNNPSGSVPYYFDEAKYASRLKAEQRNLNGSIMLTDAGDAGDKGSTGNANVRRSLGFGKGSLLGGDGADANGGSGGSGVERDRYPKDSLLHSFVPSTSSRSSLALKASQNHGHGASLSSHSHAPNILTIATIAAPGTGNGATLRAAPAYEPPSGASSSGRLGSATGRPSSGAGGGGSGAGGGDSGRGGSAAHSGPGTAAIALPPESAANPASSPLNSGRFSMHRQPSFLQRRQIVLAKEKGKGQDADSS